MEESTEEPVGLVERVCAIDIGKAGLVVCVRVPHDSKPGRRMQEVREYAATTPALLGLADWLHRQQVQLVAMQAVGSRRSGASTAHSGPCAAGRSTAVAVVAPDARRRWR